ncbi:XRE family transcriptional regulator [Chryseobacterium shigense]|uniref:DNA-binding transcriptional regulator, XRE-family HTH domain n=1 Tax=Chryseobacterium shigense TaxID=297244 RepID=A0A1N7KAD7_9FLAO|nr:helix-turn-helix domain-containing protein [Chryseobacterium shigense]PQA91188.1 XRE family transcriptional regulator [Chryseobacterium shigense]SIS58460.1 DNA-binding transcriptional regulator, XRE-family HTH domain [Chryseobacterium shigense]
MKNAVKVLREKKNMTQTELAESSGVSLRTVQRIEAGNIPKGFTLKAIARTLETEPENLISATDEVINVDRAKLINLSALIGLIVPYGGVIFPLILTYKTRDPFNKELGRNLVSIQIILAGIVSVLMITSPFIQKALSLKIPLFLVFLIAFISVKLFIIIRNGIGLNKNGDLYIKLKTSFL